LVADQGKYASAARLGSSVVVKSKLLEVGHRLARWEQSAVDAATGQTLVSALVSAGLVNRANVLVPLPSTFQLPPSTSEGVDQPLIALQPFPGSPQITSVCTVYADEVGPTGLLNLHACLCYFERNRTDFIGGADGLKALQEVMPLFSSSIPLGLSILTPSLCSVQSAWDYWALVQLG
jgi:acyl-CoA thioesterase FadM